MDAFCSNSSKLVVCDQKKSSCREVVNQGDILKDQLPWNDVKIMKL